MGRSSPPLQVCICNTQDQKGQEKERNPKSRSGLVEPREELDESERDPGDRVSDQLGESARELGELGLNEKTLISGLGTLFKHLILFPIAHLRPYSPEPETLSLHCCSFKLSFHFG